MNYPPNYYFRYQVPAEPGKQFFMNCEMNPEAVANGALYNRLDPVVYPAWGQMLD